MTFSITKAPFATDKETNETIYKYTLSNGTVEVAIMSRGCTILSVKTPDRDGKVADVVLGYGDYEDWKKNAHNFNSIVGRYANRIAKGQCVIDGQQIQLATNNGTNHLHGGPTGFYTRNFKELEQIKTDKQVGVALGYVSADGEENYPGELNLRAKFLLGAQNDFTMEFEAITNKTTIVNICNHAYWNLSGNYKENILGHEMRLNANHCTPIDDVMIPTGEIAAVKDTHMDFTTPHTIGERIDTFKTVDPPANGGYDHNYVLDSNANKPNASIEGVHACQLKHAGSGRVMDIYTSAPAIQVYTGNFLDGSTTGKEGKQYAKHAGMCLETQVHPDSPNRPNFPSPILKPGEVYRHVVIHVFSVEK